MNNQPDTYTIPPHNEAKVDKNTKRPENYVEADDAKEMTQPDNSDVQTDLSTKSKYEENFQNEIISAAKEKREQFKFVIRITLWLIALMYIALAAWVFCKSTDQSYSWHIASILAIPPTTLLFPLIKVLSNGLSSQTDTKSIQTPLGEWLNQTTEVLEKILGVFKK